MTKREKSKRLKIILVVFTILTTISSIQLEILHGEPFMGISFKALVWIHIVVSSLFIIVASNHIAIYWGDIKGWITRFNKLKKRHTKWLISFLLVTGLTGIIVALPFIIGDNHSTLGGIHGKLGFAALIFTFLHPMKRFRG